MVSVLVPSVASAAACPTLASGDMIKVVGKPAIYAVDNNLKVRAFFVGDDFKSWTQNNSYSGSYISVSQECFDSLQTPSVLPTMVTARPGTAVVYRGSSDQLYVILPNNTLSKITVDAAKALYGASFKKVLVQDIMWPNFVNRGADITSGVPHEGMLVSNGGKTWYVDAGSVLREVTASGMTANRFQTKYVHTVTGAMISGFTTGSVIDAQVAAIVDRTQSGGANGATQPGTVTGGNLMVSLAADNPASAYLASGTALNPVLKLTLTAGSNDVSVTSVKLRKGAFFQNSNITGVDVIDSTGMRHGNVVSTLTADSDALITFTNQPITVRAGMTEKVTIRVNLLAGTTGTLNFSALDASAIGSNGTVTGAFPIMGNTFNIQDGSTSIATVVLNPQAVNPSGAGLNADATNEQDIAKFSVQETSSREDVKLMKLTLYNNGTAADTDVADVQLVEQSSNTVLATAQMSNKTVMFNLGDGYLMTKGNIKYFVVRAKLVNGAARTLQFVVYNDYDAEIMGVTTKAMLLPTTNSSGNSSTSNFPAGNATNYNKVTINSGTVSFNKDASSPTASVTPGSNNVLLAKYFAKASGENMELRKINVAVTNSGPKALAGTLYVKVDGAVVYSAAASTIDTNTGTNTTITLSTYPVLKSNVNSYITVEANIDSTATSTNIYKAYVDLIEVKRLITNDIMDPAVTEASGNNISVQGSNLAVVNLATPIAQNVVAGTTNFEVCRIELNAGNSGEDIRVNSVMLTDTLTGAAADSDVANFVMYDKETGQALQTTASTNALSGHLVTFTFANALVVSRTMPKTLICKTDFVAGTSGSHKFAVTTTGSVVGYGKESGNSATITGPSGTGQAMTLQGSGTLTLSLVSGGPQGTPSNNQVVNIATTDVPVFAFKLSASNEDQKLTTLTLTASSTAAYSLGSTDVINLRLYRNNDSQPFASGNQMSCTSNTCSYTWTNSDNLLPSAIVANQPVTIYVKADIGGRGQAQATGTFKFYINATSTDLITKGAFTGATSTVAGTALASGLTHIVPWNVAVEGVEPAANSTVEKTISAGTYVARFKVTNYGSGAVTVTNVRLADNGNHTGSTTTYKLWISSDGQDDYQNGNSGAAVTTTGADFTNHAYDFSGGMTTFTINGGSYRFLTVTINTASTLSAVGDTYSMAVASLGDLQYSLTEADYGYDNNGDADQSDTMTNVFMNGRPALGTFSKK